MRTLMVGVIGALILVCLPTLITTRAQDWTLQLEEDFIAPVVVNRWRRDTEGLNGTQESIQKIITPAPTQKGVGTDHMLDSSKLLLRQNSKGKPIPKPKKGELTTKPPTRPPPTFDEENSEMTAARVNMGGSNSKPPWPANVPVNLIMGGQNGMCTGQCKPPPSPTCSEPNIYDRDVIRSTAPAAGCCKTFKCYHPDGSFFTFHGLLGVLTNTNGPPSPVGAANYGATANRGSGGSISGQGNVISGQGAYRNTPQVPYNSGLGASANMARVPYSSGPGTSGNKVQIPYSSGPGASANNVQVPYSSGPGASANKVQVPYNSGPGASANKVQVPYNSGQVSPNYISSQGSYNSGSGGNYTATVNGGQGGVGTNNNVQGGSSNKDQGNFNTGRGGNSGPVAPSNSIPTDFSGIHASYGFEDSDLELGTDYVLDTAKQPKDGRMHKGIDVNRVVSIAGSGKAHVEASAHDDTKSEHDETPDEDVYDMEEELKKVEKQNQRTMDEFSKAHRELGRSFGKQVQQYDYDLKTGHKN